MRLTRLALCLVLVACGGSKKPATMPAESTAAPAEPAAPAEGAAPAADAAASESAAAPGGGAPAPAAAAPPAPKPVTRGAKTKKSEDPDAGGE